MTVKMEVFSGDPPCSACAALLSLADEYAVRYSAELEVIKQVGQAAVARFNECGLWCTPAVVIEEMIRIEGICPSRETLDRALQEAGLQTAGLE